MSNFFVGLGITLLVLVVLFLIFREVICWYWKVNRMVELLESIDSRLSMSVAGNAMATKPTSTSGPSVVETCPFCKEQSLRSNAACEHCGHQKH